ncbi:MAG: Orotate phosphoribosyltransferase [Candidatus Eremiobacteraeota bacterium]|nr:Orotate phosphoribosyltransferase [Candidatus Eremiobacteraeota bacterium]
MTDRSALRELLLQRCFLDADALVPIAATDAATPWYFYGCGLTLRHDGLLLAADALLEELERFGAAQIATYGMGALPLLGAMIARSPRPLTGLFVRKEPKTYGLRRLVEGTGDRSQPVVFVDESMTFGGSAKAGLRALEAEGYEVEGVLTLVDLAGHGTERFFPARGYTKRVVFDVYDDLGKARESPAPARAPAEVRQSGTRVPDGLSPADAVRFIAGLGGEDGALPGEDGAVPIAPACFDAAYDAAGGFHVSVRSDDDGVRVAMVTARGVGSDEFAGMLVRAGVRAIASARKHGADLERCTIGVNIVGAERALDLRDLDHRRHVLTLRAKDGSWRRASTLPNVEFFQSEIGQIAHVKRKGRFTEEERYDAFAADSVRSVESAKRWPRYGAPPAAESRWPEDKAIAASLHARARYAVARAMGCAQSEPPPVAPIPEPLYGVGISLYAGTLIGCQISFGDALGDCIDRATAGAWGDDRFRKDRPAHPDEVDVLVSVLHERRVLPKMPLAEAARWVLLGRHSVAAYGNDDFALILAPYGVLGDYSPVQFLREVARKAKIPVERARWLTFETAAWLSEARGISALDRGFPRRAEPQPPTIASLRARLARHCAYVAATVQPDGLPAYEHDVERGTHTYDGSGARLLFVAHALDAGTFDGSRTRTGLERFLLARDAGKVTRAMPWDVACDAMLLTALDELGDDALIARFAPDAVERLAQLVHADGAIFAGRRIDGDLDFLSGSVLEALGVMDRRGFKSLDAEQLARAFAFYRKRFDLVAPWGMVWWHTAGWFAWRHRVDAYGFACELADFALARQHRASGAFLTDYTDEPAFHTACVLEGIVTAWEYALERGDAERARRCRDAWFEGQRFMETLTYGPDDNYFLRTVPLDGGVRATPVSANVRTDFVGHAISSLTRGLRLLGAAPDHAGATSPEPVR